MIRSMFLRVERDHEYRQRVLAACRTKMLRDQARCSTGSSLDSVGDFVDVTRRIIEDEA